MRVLYGVALPENEQMRLAVAIFGLQLYLVEASVDASQPREVPGLTPWSF